MMFLFVVCLDNCFIQIFLNPERDDKEEENNNSLTDAPTSTKESDNRSKTSIM